MKKSARVSLAFLSSLAATFVGGCDDGGDWVEAKRCVDGNSVVVEDRLCEQPARSGPLFYRHYYGGGGYYPGDVAHGGAWTPRGGVQYLEPSRVPRGGFGTTGRAFVSRSGAIGG